MAKDIRVREITWESDNSISSNYDDNSINPRMESEALKKPMFEKLKAFNDIKCDACLGKIKAGMPVIRCNCGKKYHETCATRIGKCFCGIMLKY